MLFFRDLQRTDFRSDQSNLWIIEYQGRSRSRYIFKLGIYVENLREVTINNLYEAQKYFKLGNENRHVAETNMNVERYKIYLVRDHTPFLP